MKRNSKREQSNMVENNLVTIIHGEKSVGVIKERLNQDLFSSAKEQFDTTLMGGSETAYYNAYEWILANLYRAMGIQLYADGEIRINIIPPLIIDNKKCLFLKADTVIDRSFDNVLYIELLNQIYGYPAESVLN